MLTGLCQEGMYQLPSLPISLCPRTYFYFPPFVHSNNTLLRQKMCKCNAIQIHHDILLVVKQHDIIQHRTNYCEHNPPPLTSYLARKKPSKKGRRNHQSHVPPKQFPPTKQILQVINVPSCTLTAMYLFVLLAYRHHSWWRKKQFLKCFDNVIKGVLLSPLLNALDGYFGSQNPTRKVIMSSNTLIDTKI